MTVLLKVPHYSQMDNIPNYQGANYTQCCTSANAMLAQYARVKNDYAGIDVLAKQQGFKSADDYWGMIVSRYGNGRGTWHINQTNALKAHRIGSTYEGMSPDEIKHQLEKGYPVVVGVKYKTSGHIIIIIGYDDFGFTVNDPYGIRAGATHRYSQIGLMGGGDKYSYGLWNKVTDWMGRKVRTFNDDDLGVW